MKNLPIGMQSIKKILGENFLYIDKTETIYKLMTEGQYYFLSRPRRFGKSLLLSTLEAIFKGDKELFKDCSIYNKEYDWKEHPIIYFDFTQIPTRDTQELEAALKRVLEDTAHSYKKSIRCPTLQEGLANLVITISDLGPVVVLIDEYDKPLLDNLEEVEVAASNQRLLKDFYGTLKGLDKYLRLVLVTGVTKFSHVSLFSGFNNLNDITIDPDYATLLGYTELELQQFMKDRISKIVDERTLVTPDATEEDVLADMKEWYNGYRFSWGAQAVYNPHSTFSFLKTGRVQNYWYRTGTPTFLIEQIRKRPGSMALLSGSIANENELLDIGDVTHIGLKPLMWQTGYLTIRDYDQLTRLYELDFPNREVREAFFGSLLHEFAELDVSMVDRIALKCLHQLQYYELGPFLETINALFARIPYSLFHKGSEASYHAVFVAMLEAMGIKVHAEEQTNVGRIDLVIEMPCCIYIMELKFNKNAESALKQIEANKYLQRYSIEEKDLLLLGLNFSETTRNISECKAIIYRKNCSEGEKLTVSL